MWYHWIGVLAYIYLLTFLFNCLYKNFSANKKAQKYYIIFALLPIFFLMAFRDPTAYTGDINSYYNFFIHVGKTPWDKIFSVVDRFEWGYVILNKILYTICPWGQAIFVFEAAFCLISLGVFIYKNTNSPFYSVLAYLSLGIFNFQMTGFRQAIAIGIIMISVEAIKKKKVIRFMLLMILAFLFHKSSIVFIVAYFVLNKNLTAIWQAIIIVVTMGLAYYLGVIYEIAIETFELDEYTVSFKGSVWGGIFILLIYSAILLAYFTNKHKLKPREHFLYNTTEVGAILYAFRYLALSMERVSLYYSFASVVTLPNSLALIKNRELKFWGKIIYAVLLSFYFINMVSYSKWAVFVPIWS